MFVQLANTTAQIKAEVDEAIIRAKKRELKVRKAYYEVIKEKKKQSFNHVVAFDLQQVSNSS